MKRREFLVSAAAGAVAATGFARPARAAGAGQAKKQAALDRISIMSLNFQSILQVPDVPSTPERTLDFFDYATMIADTYGVHKVEFQHYHLASLETSYLRELRSRVEKAKSQVQQINLEFNDLHFSAPRVRDRLLAIDLTKMFVDHAVTLGAKRVMVNQGGPQGQPTHENKVYGIPTLKTMVDYGKSKGIIVSVETRGGGGGGRGRATGAGRAGTPGSPVTPAPAPAAAAPAPQTPAAPPPLTGRAAWTLLAEIIQAAGSYSNVDVGGAGAPNQQDLHDCLKMMAPFTAGTMHTRVNQNWDLATAMCYLENDLKWHGLYTIETGQGHAGTKEIYDVVVETLTA
ncbi:MAG: hypothetical protein IT184_08435 [Acidobacteria bacterium]|nr:hypothetical protein [Acidobacteriota bacterium]